MLCHCKRNLIDREIHDHQKISLKARLGHRSDQGKVWAPSSSVLKEISTSLFEIWEIGSVI
ncbi:MAG: hypothetical protein AABY80_08170 [Candidatus Deferrimicrobiota bacterium]